MQVRRGLVCAVAWAGVVGSAGAQDVTFEDVSVSAGLSGYRMPFGMAGGVAAADYDGDGDIDVFAPCAEGTADLLFRNRGDGTFEEVGAGAGVASLTNNRAALWLDYDGDADLDLLVAGDCHFTICSQASTLRLYRQEAGGVFVDVTASSGLAGHLTPISAHFGGMCAGDIDSDGYLDLFVGIWAGASFVFRNNGAGGFSNISLASGAGGHFGKSWQPVLHDFDGDGDQDVFWAVDFDANQFWRNNGDGTFTDIAGAAGVASAWNEMGVAVGDFDGDEDFDLYVTNIAREGRHNLLLRNDTAGGAIQFSEVSQQHGVAETFWGWGTTFLDCDLDGDLDLAATNGFNEPGWLTDPSRFFLNTGAAPSAFADVSAAVGFDDTLYGAGLIAFDYDRDGDLDLLQACAMGQPLRLLENRRTGAPASSGHLVVRPRMNGPNSHAIGAVVRITAGGRTMSRLITCGTSLMGQEPAEAHFGLGAAATATVVVRWPGGGETTLSGVAANQALTVWPCAADVTGDGSVDVFDLLAYLDLWFAGDAAAERTGDDPASVDVFDLLVYLDGWFEGC